MDELKEVKKMTAFILQEAAEKVHELRLKADEEYSVEKARLLRRESLAIESRVDKRRREGEVRVRIAQSGQSNKGRLAVERERERVLSEVYEEVKMKLQSEDGLLEQLVKEGVGLLHGEEALTVECRPEDLERVRRSAPNLSIASTLQKEGVVVSARGGRIRCDNSLEARLELAIRGLAPEVRLLVFGVNKNRKFFD